MRTSQTRRWSASAAACLAATMCFGALPAAAAQPHSGKKQLLVIQTQHHEDIGSLIAKRTFNDFVMALVLDPNVEAVMADGLVEVKKVEIVETPTVDPTIEKADEALETGKDYELKKEWEPAIEAFKEAMDLYEKEMARLENFDKYVDAVLSRALAYYQMKLDDNGEDELTKVVVLRPTTVLDKRKTPKGALDTLKRLQSLYANSHTGAVAVLADAPRAVVFLDGNLVGDAPVKLEGMYPGRHWVRVVADGYFPWVQAFEATTTPQVIKAMNVQKAVEKKAPDIPAATPEELAEAARTGAFGASFDGHAKSTCEKYGLDGIVLTYMRPNGASYELAGFYFDGAIGKLVELPWAKMDIELTTMKVAVLELSGEVVKAATTSFPTDRIVTESSDIYQPPKADGTGVVDLPPTVIRLPDGTIIERAGIGVPPPDGGGKKLAGPAFYEEWWFWTLVTVAVAGGGAATYFALQPDAATPTGFRTTVQF